MHVGRQGAAGGARVVGRDLVHALEEDLGHAAGAKRGVSAAQRERRRGRKGDARIRPVDGDDPDILARQGRGERIVERRRAEHRLVVLVGEVDCSEQVGEEEEARSAPSLRRGER